MFSVKCLHFKCFLEFFKQAKSYPAHVAGSVPELADRTLALVERPCLKPDYTVTGQAKNLGF